MSVTAKHKGVGPQALTANDLRDGLNVWMTADYTWSTQFSDALLTEDPEILEKMQMIGTQFEEANQIVAAYFIDIDPESGLPVRYREKFRVTGPTHDRSNYPENSKRETSGKGA